MSFRNYTWTEGSGRAIESGRELDPGPALAARKRSLHNNYLTCRSFVHARIIRCSFTAIVAWLVLIF